MYFVTEIIATGPKTFIERNVRVGGYMRLTFAHKAAKRCKPCLVRNHNREIVAQTISPSFANYVK